MKLRIIKPGLFSTVQDMGRMQYLSQGVAVSGAMDTLSARLANKALGNNDTDAVIEFTYDGAELLAETDMLVAYSGGGAILETEGQLLAADKPLFIPLGNKIKLVHRTPNCRTYLAVAGGWDVPEVLGSRSTFITAKFGGFKGRKLEAGDVLSASDNLSPITEAILSSLKSDQVSFPDWQISPLNFLPADKSTIRVIRANEFGWFDEKTAAKFFSSSYTLSAKNNRMGYHMEGPAIERIDKNELLSTAVTPGTIQVTGNGSMILLMADCQTTGGYPRIAQVAAVDISLCGQLKPGDAINFKEISLKEAEMLYIELEKELNKIDIAIGLKYF